MSEIVIWKITVGICILALFFVVRCLFDANTVLNWYVREYHSVPRINPVPKRKKYHELLLRFLACTIVHPKNYLKKLEA